MEQKRMGEVVQLNRVKKLFFGFRKSGDRCKLHSAVGQEVLSQIL
jgi:hypothetical protein